MTKFTQLVVTLVFSLLFLVGCNNNDQDPVPVEYFNLRPSVEQTNGYAHAVKIGNRLKIAGAVSMDDAGNLKAAGDLGQQMRNAYADLNTILKHFGYSFDDVTIETVYTTDMAEFIKQSPYRKSIYTKQFPASTWVGVPTLFAPGYLIEIELEAYKAN